MPLDLTPLDSASRLLVEAELKVATGGGGRFQPTGFPGLGPALYRGADGATWLLVESPQSMANRLERVCWVDGDEESDRVGRYNDACKGIPYVLATDSDNRPLTASTLEAHRLSSPYIWDTQPVQSLTSRTSGEITEPVGEEHARATQENSTPGANGQGEDRISSGETLPEYLKRLFNLSENRLVPWKKIAVGLLKVDPGCLLHGIWFNESSFAGGKVRITRALSGYIEARDPSTANFGFQKRDPVSDRTDKDAGQSAAEGYGSVIGPKQHFTSPEVKAYFQIDLERLRSYGLLQKEVHALAAWGIYKIRRVLVASRDGVADLRTECKFETAAIVAQVVDQETGKKTPFPLPELGEDLKQAFDVLKMSTGPLCVRWVPSIQGKAEMPESVNDNELSRQGLEAKVKVETPKPKRGKKETKPAKRFLILSGEWSESDKRKLREQNPNDPTKSVIEKALADFERNWEAKAQSRKADESDADDQDRDGDQE